MSKEYVETTLFSSVLVKMAKCIRASSAHFYTPRYKVILRPRFFLCRRKKHTERLSDLLETTSSG